MSVISSLLTGIINSYFVVVYHIPSAYDVIVYALLLSCDPAPCLCRLAGTCYSGNNYETNACGDNMYSSPYGNATLGAATIPFANTDDLWNEWLNRADVQSAIHALKPRVPHSDCSDVGYDVTWPSLLPDYAAAFNAGLKILIFSGDVDVTTCPFESTQLAVLELQVSVVILGFVCVQHARLRENKIFIAVVRFALRIIFAYCKLHHHARSSFVPCVQTAFPDAGTIVSNWTGWQVKSLPFNQTVGYIETHKGFTFATIKAGGVRGRALEYSCVCSDYAAPAVQLDAVFMCIHSPPPPSLSR